MKTDFTPALAESAARGLSGDPISAGQCRLVVKLLCSDGAWLAGLLGLAALATCSPGFHAWCVLDREAVAAGEMWRLWTGHFAHFSASHLWVDAMVFVLLAAALRRAGESSPGRVLGFGGAGLSVSLLCCDAELARYGGLSGLNALLLGQLVVRWLQPELRGGSAAMRSAALRTAAATTKPRGAGSSYTALHKLPLRAGVPRSVHGARVHTGSQQRVLGLALLALTVGKFALDSLGWSSPSVDFGSAAVVPSHLSHWLGLGWGLVLASCASGLGERRLRLARG